MFERNHRLIDIKITQYLLPAVIMKLALQLGNIVDTILVGNLLGTEAMAAVNLAIPVLSLIQIPGFFLGNGGAITAGIFLGKRDRHGASETFTLTFLLTAAFGLLFLAFSFAAPPALAHLLSHGSALEPMVRQYIFVCLAGAPVLGIGLHLSAFFAGDNHPQLASAYFITSNTINLLLDYLLLKYTPLGVLGAALSTMIGFALGLVITVLYVRSPKRMIGFVKPRVSKEILKSVTAMGMPYLSYLVSTMVKLLMMNTIVLSFLGERGMAIYAVCNNVILILAMVTGGIVGVIPNFAGILYGERDYFSIRALCRRVLTYGYLVTGVLMVLILVFAPQVCLMFGITDESLKEIMVVVLRFLVFAMPAYLWNVFCNQYYGPIKRPGLATLTTWLQNGIILIPATYFCILAGQHSGGSGYNGLAFAFILSEFLTALTVTLFRRIKYPGEPILMVPDKTPGVYFDFTIPAQSEKALSAAQEIQSFCVNHGVDARKANLITVAAEEMMVNIIQHGGKKSEWIDVCLSVEDDRLRLRLRDNGIPFDPTTYTVDEEEFDIHGIQLALAVSTNISYIRAIDMNNTIIELER